MGVRLFFKKRWQRLSPTLKRGTQGLSFAFLISVGVLAIAYAYAWWHFSNLSPSTSSTIVEPWSLSAARIFTFIDSVAAGIAAFALLGAFTFLYSLRRPEEDTVDDRVAYLYSARREESPAANKYLRDQVTLLGATIRKVKFTYTILEVSEDGFVRISVGFEAQVVNNMKYDRYQQQMPLKIEVEPIEGFVRDIACVQYVNMTSCNRNGDYQTPTRFLQYPHRLTNSKPSAEWTLDVNIPANGELRYEYLFECWNLGQDEQQCGANRFAEEFVVEVINMTDKPFDVVPVIRPPLHHTMSDTHRLAEGETKTFDFSGVHPTHQIIFQLNLL